MLNTVGRLIYTKYWEILYVEHCWKIYLHKILGNTLCWTLLEDLFTQNTLCWTLLEDLFTQNTGKYFMLNTGKIYLHKILWNWEILYVEHCWKIYWHTILGNTFCWTLWEDLFTQNTRKYFMLYTVEDLFTQNTGKLGNTLCWALLEDILTHNTRKYFLFNTVGRFIYTKY
jgi:hypothetical protein